MLFQSSESQASIPSLLKHYCYSCSLGHQHHFCPLLCNACRGWIPLSSSAFSQLDPHQAFANLSRPWLHSLFTWRITLPRCMRVVIHFSIPFGSPQGALFHSPMRREMARKTSSTVLSLQPEQIGFWIGFPVRLWCHFSCVYFCHVSSFWSRGLLREGVRQGPNERQPAGTVQPETWRNRRKRELQGVTQNIWEPDAFRHCLMLS